MILGPPELETLVLLEMNQGDLGYGCLFCDGQICMEKSHIYLHKRELEVIRDLRSRCLSILRTLVNLQIFLVAESEHYCFRSSCDKFGPGDADAFQDEARGPHISQLHLSDL